MTELSSISIKEGPGLARAYFLLLMSRVCGSMDGVMIMIPVISVNLRGICDKEQPGRLPRRHFLLGEFGGELGACRAMPVVEV